MKYLKRITRCFFEHVKPEMSDIQKNSKNDKYDKFHSTILWL